MQLKPLRPFPNAFKRLKSPLTFQELFQRSRFTMVNPPLHYYSSIILLELLLEVWNESIGEIFDKAMIFAITE